MDMVWKKTYNNHSVTVRSDILSLAFTRKWLVLVVLVMSFILPHAVGAADDSDNTVSSVVVLVHGFLRTKYSMYFMEKELINDGYLVINVTYPSNQNSIEESADYLNHVLSRRLSSLDGEYELYFVTHSMGALVTRCYLATYRPKSVVRMVMIAPPNRGAKKAEFFKEFPLSGKVLGPSGMEMAQGEDYLLELCDGAPDVYFGIIAGGKGDGEGYSSLIPGDDDGTVSVWTTYLPEAHDFLLVEHYHTFVCNYRDVIDNTRHFLNTGQFLVRTVPPE
jgi:pimeloyl-ACP methyl ester carboxylesterase